jgi:hypothetical protein
MTVDEAVSAVGEIHRFFNLPRVQVRMMDHAWPTADDPLAQISKAYVVEQDRVAVNPKPGWQQFIHEAARQHGGDNNPGVEISLCKHAFTHRWFDGALKGTVAYDERDRTGDGTETAG